MVFPESMLLSELAEFLHTCQSWITFIHVAPLCRVRSLRVSENRSPSSFTLAWLAFTGTLNLLTHLRYYYLISSHLICKYFLSFSFHFVWKSLSLSLATAIAFVSGFIPVLHHAFSFVTLSSSYFPIVFSATYIVLHLISSY